VRLERTGVENGFMIFLIATADWVSWSLAELRWGISGSIYLGDGTHQTRPNAPGGGVGKRACAGDESLTHPDGLQVDIAGGDLRGVSNIYHRGAQR
jgi:hypothetical protein